MMVSWDPTWDDADSPWWAKANRAAAHIKALDRLVGEYRDSEPVSLTPEPADACGRVPYRLHTKPVPVAISVTIGDVLSNLRAALESLAYEIARLEQGGALSPEQQRVPTFLIRDSPESFDAFFGGSKAALYASRAREALRAVQPFVHIETAINTGIQVSENYSQRFPFSELHRLDVLWNIDKHRRLTVLTWWPDLIWWSSNGLSTRRLLPGDGTMQDGSILYCVEGGDEEHDSELRHEFKLVLTDDPAHSPEEPGPIEHVVDLLSRLHEHVIGYVFPRIFTYMSQDSAPSHSE